MIRPPRLHQISPEKNSGAESAEKYNTKKASLFGKLFFGTPGGSLQLSERFEARNANTVVRFGLKT